MDIEESEVCSDSAESAEVLPAMAGPATVECGKKLLRLSKGQSAVIFSGAGYLITEGAGKARLFRVSVS
jgi:hypothetical protein